jgi:hypothetical protein
MLGSKRIWLAALCAAVVGVGMGAGLARAATSDPLFVFSQSTKPGDEFEGACGLAVDSTGRFYVSDYYHHAVDVFTPPASPFNNPPRYVTQLTDEDPVDGPCGLAVDSTGGLYVNNFHRNVARFTPSAFPPAVGTSYSAGPVLDAEHPTGVAVDPSDPSTDRVYVNARTYVAVYQPSGSPVEEAGSPVRIGVGTLGDGYGIAAANGLLYVPDAADNTVKIYNPAVDKVNPSATIHGPGAGFTSLRDSAIAIDRASGDIYVADAVGSPYTERPETTIDVFDSALTYQGHLKYNVINGTPVGLAVDNSTTSSQGRVYVTSGNTIGARVYAYPPGAATLAQALPPPLGLTVSTSGAGAGIGAVAGQAAGVECAIGCGGGGAAGTEAALAATPRQGRPRHAKHRQRVGKHRQRTKKHRHRSQEGRNR